MNARSVLTRSDYQDYLRVLVSSKSTDEDTLVYLYFCKGDDYLFLCIERAYRDFSWTLHGLGKSPSKGAIKEQASSNLQHAVLELRRYSNRVTGQGIFDAWHQTICQRLVQTFGSFEQPFHIGQAQKWVNMTLKYIYTLGESRLPGFGEVYPYCHAPLDNIFIERLKPYGFPELSSVWSRLDDYQQYLGYQYWIRRRFTLVPLDVEYCLWLGKAVEM